MEYFTDNPLFTRILGTIKEFTIDHVTEDDKYIGTLNGGKKDGYGKLIYKSGNLYEGEFKNDKRHGKGKITYTEYNITLEGIWINDEKVGKGIFTWPNGKQLEVNWSN